MFKKVKSTEVPFDIALKLKKIETYNYSKNSLIVELCREYIKKTNGEGKHVPFAKLLMDLARVMDINRMIQYNAKANDFIIKHSTIRLIIKELIKMDDSLALIAYCGFKYGIGIDDILNLKVGEIYNKQRIYIKDGKKYRPIQFHFAMQQFICRYIEKHKLGFDDFVCVYHKKHITKRMVLNRLKKVFEKLSIPIEVDEYTMSKTFNFLCLQAFGKALSV